MPNGRHENQQRSRQGRPTKERFCHRQSLPGEIPALEQEHTEDFRTTRIKGLPERPIGSIEHL
jgi:hypothetical protein